MLLDKSFSDGSRKVVVEASVDNADETLGYSIPVLVDINIPTDIMLVMDIFVREVICKYLQLAYGGF